MMNMICMNCGKELAVSTVTFCPYCGARVARPDAAPVMPVPVQEDPVPAAVPEPSDNAYAPVGAAPAPYAANPAQIMQTEAVYKVPPTVKKPDKAKKKNEKEFFGIGALIFCLIVIALLAGAAGMFAYLYFALLGAI